MSELLPREKAISLGFDSLNNAELLALILKTAYKDKNVLELAKEIIASANGFHNLPSMTYEELTSIKGIKKARALELMAILEVSKRLNRLESVRQEDLDSPAKVVEWLRVNLGYSDEEEFLVIFMNGSGRIIRHEKMFRGNHSSSTVGIDAILRNALLLKASYLIVSHNHPSDNVKPSQEDIEMTEKLSKSARMIGIPLLDHIIVSRTGYFSFRNNSMLK